ncbi:PHP domain-containing protein [Pyrofollis japonicus]|uniref:PHP domain-containing protein n=1 Tax=Pyrofollis japonicus TaxID=3060460 RepID=UPI00295C17AC|nr:PHP domain-containing protein [Pyrofollis japonicus]BEP16987.1 PHP domain-containing protein [Pyrofollis japonicus]
MTKIRADLHMHSTFSDGRESPKEIIIKAVEKGLSAISITDHDTFQGAIVARNIVSEGSYDIVVLLGAEIRANEGDILIYCLEEPLEKIPRNALELLDTAHENNCLAVPAHPFDIRRKGIGELVYEGKWDAIEVFNSMSDPISNQKAMEAARILNLPGLANSDAHVAEAIGSAYNIITVDDLSEAAIMEAIKSGRVTPVPGRPGFGAIASTLMWSIERRLKRRKKGPSRLDYVDRVEDEYFYGRT